MKLIIAVTMHKEIRERSIRNSNDTKDFAGKRYRKKIWSKGKLIYDQATNLLTRIESSFGLKGLVI